MTSLPRLALLVHLAHLLISAQQVFNRIRSGILVRVPTAKRMESVENIRLAVI